MTLSDAARSVWAKSPDDEGGWLPLWQHMEDSAAVAGALFDDWLAPNVVRLFAEPFGGERDVARRVLTFLAGVHDLGKATPAFAVQHISLAQRMREHGLYMPANKAALPDRWLAHHSVAGHHLLVRWLAGRGWPKNTARTWGVVLGGHHGTTPDSDSVKAARPDEVPELYGSDTWREVQDELASFVAMRTGIESELDALADIRLSAQFQVLATGLVIVSDWIASNQDLLPYHRGSLPPVRADETRVRRALRRLRLPEPWRPRPLPDVSTLFSQRFRLPAGAEPRPVQRAVHELACQLPEPGLLVVEAPMGEGKTEAALAAAEVFAARWNLGGVLVALPTQATTDAMFARVLAWLDAMGADDQQVSGAITLGHGKARFNRLFQGLFQSGRPAQIGCDEADGPRHSVAAHAWLTGRKKALLANFAVVTIDQLLFAGLTSRHLMLRHLALAGKVVVIDEIHAYDAYMNSYLTKVLTWLGAYKVPVVALSATLPPEQRSALVDAYQRGRGGTAGQPDAGTAYPALTSTTGTSSESRAVRPSGRSTSVAVTALTDDLDQLVSVLRDALADGGAALVVRNTVRRVLAAADRLEREFPGEVTVAHSRFIVADRLRKDTELLDGFGAPGRASRRPWRHIVVASQVVEQSLDVDFDLLVTDLAPVDLVLQRMGRLHRHQRDRPRRVSTARVYLTGADFGAAPPELEPAAARHVYGAYPLLRSAVVLAERFGRTIELPGDIADLVRRAYGADEIGPPEWREAMAAARATWLERTEKRERKAGTFQIAPPSRPGKAIIGWLSASIGETDDEAQGQGQVRDGAPSLEALLLVRDEDGRWRTPGWLPDGAGNLPVPREEPPPDDLAETMAACVLRLPLTFSNPDAEDELWQATPPAWEQSPLIYRQPVLVVDRGGYGRINDRSLRYTPERGLEVFDSAG
ncbi:CRISPR-associated endonuclease/helicase Cas3 [Prauserella shujinwangii]|uniref:CRISPR-associated endonuclease/helicase Cas3 n=1 Tax=Prauserella shujinwangii TaxID=1453103 RepID=A0A2T0M2Z1_9PSEU|nr:CRISPR-associated helicase Cas3' [Prauserella shujinwangii]PRX51079.1 CRISPR-associated endonuclease/helicase Cas3 [Prauserella shujinwangii]